jgi:hypothetical protein
LPSPKCRNVIAPADVTHVFDDKCIRRLADTAKLPKTADIDRFTRDLRLSVRLYADRAREPTCNEWHDEIARLYASARRRSCAKVVELVDALSLSARTILDEKKGLLGERIHCRSPLPPSCRSGQSECTCDIYETLCCMGGRVVLGRRRSLGRRSRSWQPLLEAPERRRNFPKRQAEQHLVMLLQIDWLLATGTNPPVTADHRNPGPFARMVRECLRLVGASHADAVGLINELDRQRRGLTPPKAI